MEKDLDYWKRKSMRRGRLLRIMGIIVGVLLMAVVISAMYYFQDRDGGSPFIGQQRENIAVSNVQTFRGKYLPKHHGFGVWYDSADIRLYLDSIYPKLVDSQRAYIKRTQPNVDLSNCAWKLAFYWAKVKDTTDNKVRTDFCVVPILADTIKPKHVFDYFDDGLKLYSHNVKMPATYGKWKHFADGEDGSFAFDTGNMFP